MGVENIMPDILGVECSNSQDQKEDGTQFLRKESHLFSTSQLCLYIQFKLEKEPLHISS